MSGSVRNSTDWNVAPETWAGIMWQLSASPVENICSNLPLPTIKLHRLKNALVRHKPCILVDVHHLHLPDIVKKLCAHFPCPDPIYLIKTPFTFTKLRFPHWRTKRAATYNQYNVVPPPICPQVQTVTMAVALDTPVINQVLFWICLLLV